MAYILTKLRSAISRHPVAANMFIFGTMYGSGDISQQTIRRFEKYDFKNTARVAAVAGLIFGPLFHRWYLILDRLVIGHTTKEIIFKVLLDQCVIAPPCICIFYTATSILEGREDKFEELREKGLKTFKVGCLYWPIVQSINFFFLPTYLRGAYVATGSFVWTNILCFIKSQETRLAEEASVSATSS